MIMNKRVDLLLRNDKLEVEFIRNFEFRFIIAEKRIVLNLTRIPVDKTISALEGDSTYAPVVKNP